VGCGGPSSVYLSTLSLGGATRIEYRPWEVESVLFVVTFGVIPAVVVVVVTVADSAVSGTSGGLVGCGGPSSVYLSTLSLGGATRIEYRPWEVESVLFVVTCCVISAEREEEEGGHDK